MEKFINKILLRYFLLYSVFVVLGFFLLKFHYHQNYSQEKYEQLLSTKSSFREITNNPCKYQINGDPVYSKSGYIKLNLYCLNGEKSLNTLSLVSIKENLDYESVISELSKINSFDKNIILKSSKKWKCNINGKNLEFNSSIVKDSVVNCYEINE